MRLHLERPPNGTVEESLALTLQRALESLERKEAYNVDTAS